MIDHINHQHKRPPSFPPGDLLILLAIAIALLYVQTEFCLLDQQCKEELLWFAHSHSSL